MSAIITRAQWGAKHGRGADVSSRLPWGEMVWHTEAGAMHSADMEDISTLAVLNLHVSEATKLRAIENFHVKTRGWKGIAYSFLIFPDGTIAEGRGWGFAGGHTEGRNSTAAGICFIGHGDLQAATEAQWASARWLVGEGIRVGAIKPNPLHTTHAKYSGKGKTCPGTLIAPHINARLDGITGPIPYATQEADVMTPEQQAILADAQGHAAAASLRAQAIEQRLVRIQAALNIEDVGVEGHDGKKPYPVRLIESNTRIEEKLGSNKPKADGSA